MTEAWLDATWTGNVTKNGNSLALNIPGHIKKSLNLKKLQLDVGSEYEVKVDFKMPGKSEDDDDNFYGVAFRTYCDSIFPQIKRLYSKGTEPSRAYADVETVSVYGMISRKSGQSLSALLASEGWKKPDIERLVKIANVISR